MPEQLYSRAPSVSRVGGFAGVPPEEMSIQTNLQLRHLVEQNENRKKMREVPKDPKDIERHGYWTARSTAIVEE